MNSSRYSEGNFTGVRTDTTVKELLPDADVISLETVVNMLVQKGICTQQELFALENRLQEMNPNSRGNTFVNVKSTYDRGRFPGLKKKMSKKKWTRKLGSILFGWKWKKVKNNPVL